MMPNDVKKWLDKDGIAFLENIGIQKNHFLLDFGCGEGHYTIPAGKVVGEGGKVYAVDKDKVTLNHLMLIAKSEGLKNIVPIVDHSEELKIDLEYESIDVMLFYDVLHYMEPEKRKRVYKNAYQILKNDAILSVYPKHCTSDDPLWNLGNLKVENVIKEIERANFSLESKSLNQLIHDDNYDKGYILNFMKS